MKTLVPILLALGIGFASAYVIVSKQKSQRAPAPAAAPAATPSAAAPAPRVVVKSVVTPSAGEAPQDILNDLLGIRMGLTAGERNTALRTVVYKLESLAQCGRDGVPAIRQFMGRSVDVNYSQETQNPNDNQGNGNGGNGPGNQFGNGNGGGFRGGARRARNLQNLQTDWVVPPSLRLGLVSTLKEIGGADAEKALSEMLSNTARGVEVAYLTVVLEEMAPGRYRDEAVKAAKELLTNPVAVDSPDRLDELSKSYLYGVLLFYKDASFAATAQQMLVGKDGRLDPDALDYLSTVLGDQAVATLYAAYSNSALTNQFDKMRLGRDILSHVGQSSQADQLLASIVSNPDANRERIFALAALAGGFGNDVPTDPQVIAARIRVLNSLLGQYSNDPTLARVIPQVINALQNGKPIDRGDLFGGGQGGGGRRGGGGGQ